MAIRRPGRWPEDKPGSVRSRQMFVFPVFAVNRMCTPTACRPKNNAKRQTRRASTTPGCVCVTFIKRESGERRSREPSALKTQPDGASGIDRHPCMLIPTFRHQVGTSAHHLPPSYHTVCGNVPHKGEKFPRPSSGQLSPNLSTPENKL